LSWGRDLKVAVPPQFVNMSPY